MKARSAWVWTLSTGAMTVVAFALFCWFWASASVQVPLGLRWSDLTRPYGLLSAASGLLLGSLTALLTNLALRAETPFARVGLTVATQVLAIVFAFRLAFYVPMELRGFFIPDIY